MALRITLDMFSGRPNPTIELADVQLPGRTKLSDVKKLLTEATINETPPPLLGYRRAILEETSSRSPGFGRRFVEDVGAVNELLSDQHQLTLANLVLGMKCERENKKTQRAFKSFREFISEKEDGEPGKKKPPTACKCAPLYEPAWWNDAGQRQFGNNCYNYSTNHRTDTYAQPGRAAGQQYAALDCTAVHAAALADDLIDAEQENECPSEGHLVALVIAPGFDYHWYRKGRDGHWTHKPGGTQATNLDNSGKIITNPQKADRGPYTMFCKFMVVKHGHIKIG